MFTPIAKSESSIRNYVFEKYPKGTHIDVVVKSIAEEGKWEIRNVRHTYGIENPNDLQGKDIGTKSLAIYLGGYKIIFSSDVRVYIAFDDKGKLIEVVVIKDVDVF
jgi:hypothetical protein